MSKDHYASKSQEYFSYGRPEMLQFIPEETSHLLEIGCGEGAFGANLKLDRQIHITAIEPFERAAEIAMTRLDRVLVADVESGLQELSGQRYGCVVFNDVLEHLLNPWDVLIKIKPLLLDAGVVVVSLPSIRYMPVLKDLVLQADWQYQDAGVLDRTHLRFFTQKSIRRLFEQTGYEITNLQGINGITFPWKFSLLNRLAFGALSDTRFPQFACVARIP